MLIEIFRLLRYLIDFEFRNDHLVRFTRFTSSWYRETESCQKHFFKSGIVLLFHALTCNEEKDWRWRFRKFLSVKRIGLNFRWCFRWCSRTDVMIINCCETITDFIWLEILDRNSYETDCISISVERCKSWWL